MQLQSWLTNLYRRLSSSKSSRRTRRLQHRSLSRIPIVERLEPRWLLSAGVATVGFETRANTATPYTPVHSSIAIDATGDYVITWQTYGQDGGRDGIYAQRYNAAGTTQGSEFRVNTYTSNSQSRPAVAMDAAGDFVITWQSDNQDGSSYGVYAQRYNAAGAAQGSEFRVNTYTTNHQAGPSVAMDAAGDFVIAWQSYTQDGSRLGIYAQRYNTAGVAQGGEFRVNTYTSLSQSLPSVAMDVAGDFVITWQSDSQDGSNYGIYAQRFNSAGTAQGVEFRVNTYTSFAQINRSVAMDAAGDFVITWQSDKQDGSNYGIFAQRYNAAGAPQGVEFNVNTYTPLNQTLPSVAMDAAGDFVITWQSEGQDGLLYGIYAQVYDAAGMLRGFESRVNTYTTNSQTAPSVAMDAAGDFVVAWQSITQLGGHTGIYFQRYVATVGPIVTGVFEGTGPRLIQNGDRLTSSVSAVTVDFSELVNDSVGGASSVSNRSNWGLSRSGADVSDLISGITFGFNPFTNRWEAVVAFVPPLKEGTYSLVARSSIRNPAGLPLDGEADGIPGGNFRRNFSVATTLPAGVETRVNTTTTNFQTAPSVAVDATGNYVITWQSYAEDGSHRGIYAQRYNAAGVAQGGQFRVNTYTTADQKSPSVAMDAAGDFVITWQSNSEDGSGYGIYAQRYNAAGIVQGSEFRVNTLTMGDQTSPSVAMDATGDFVVTWESYPPLTSINILAQRYNAAGVAQGSEFLVNSYTTDSQRFPVVAMDTAGDFVISWMSETQDGSSYGIYAQRYNAAGTPQALEFQVAFFTIGEQSFPSVAMDAAGDFVITWMGSAPDDNLFGIRAQRFNAAGDFLGTEFRVNSYTTGNQDTPSVAMDAMGNFVIAWDSYLQDGDGFSINAQRFDTAGSAQGSEFQVNTFSFRDQIVASVAMDATGDFDIGWQSSTQDGSLDGIYAQRYVADVAPVIYQIEPTPLSAVASLTTPVTSSLLAFDQDSNNWTGATIQISLNYRSDQDVLGFVNTGNITGSWNAATGTLTLSGTDTVSNYRTALRKVAYRNTSGSPNMALTRTIDFQVTDGLLSSSQISRDLTLVAASTPAVLSGVSGTGTYFENAAALGLAANLVISDVDSANLASATVSFTGWQGEDRLDFNNIFALQHTFTQDLVAHTALFTITGTETVANYQTLLRSVVYSDVSDAPNTAATRMATFRVNDGTSNSSTVTRNTVVSAVNDAPRLSAIEATPLAYKANDPAFPAQPISATLLVNEPDSNNLTKATVQITAGYQNDANGHDVLSFANQLGISGSFTAATGLLTLTGTSSVGNYRTALRSVTFGSSGSAVSTATRTLTILGTDDFTPTPATSLPITRTVTVSTTNVPPALAGIPVAALAYVRGAAAVAVAPGVFVLDQDSINLTGATIQVTGNYQNGQDVLAATNGSGITSSFNAATGTLTLSGLSSLANYQTVLRSVTYKTSTASASTATRTLTFVINDGLALSNAVTRSVTLT